MTDALRSLLGGRTASALHEAFGMSTVADLLRHSPRRYSRRGELTDLASLAEGEQVTVAAEVRRVTSRPMRDRRGTVLEVEVGDATGSLSLTFFNQAWRARELRSGRIGLFAGKVGSYRGKRQLAHLLSEIFAGIVSSDRSCACHRLLPEWRQLCWVHLVRNLCGRTEARDP